MPRHQEVGLPDGGQFDEHLVVRIAALRQLRQAGGDAHAAAVGQVVGKQLFTAAADSLNFG